MHSSITLESDLTSETKTEDAHLLAESAKTVFEEDCLSLNEGMHSSPAKADEWKKPSKRISNGDVLKMQYECLRTQKETLNLKIQKKKLQIHLLEQQVNAKQTFATAFNANFVVANADSF